mgnify:CR=1 FL=1
MASQFALKTFFLTLAGAMALSLQPVIAATADDLGKSLTPFGAEASGNADGSIPAWTGGMTTVDPSYKPGGKRGDPFASEKPLFSITAKNMAQYEGKISDGTKEMLKRYPDTYRLDIYLSLIHI